MTASGRNATADRLAMPKMVTLLVDDIGPVGAAVREGAHLG